MKSSSQQIALRYAHALFALAEKANAVDATEQSLQNVAKAAHETPTFAEFLSNPLLGRAQQKTIIAAIATKLAAPELVQRFLATLADQKRLTLIEAIATEFTAKAQAKRGEINVEVVTATSLTDAELAAIAERLCKAYNKKVLITQRTDASLLGGMIVKMGSRQLDSSVSGTLKRLEIGLKAA